MGATMLRPDSSSWRTTKAQGDAAELAVAERFRRQGYRVLRTVGRDGGFDLRAEITVEVKADMKAVSTSFVAIEVASHGQPSGINTSIADLWAFLIGNEVIVVTRRHLLALVNSGQHRAVRAGDGGSSQVVLVPVTTLKAVPGVVVEKVEVPSV